MVSVMWMTAQMSFDSHKITDEISLIHKQVTAQLKKLNGDKKSWKSSLTSLLDASSWRHTWNASDTGCLWESLSCPLQKTGLFLFCLITNGTAEVFVNWHYTSISATSKTEQSIHIGKWKKGSLVESQTSWAGRDLQGSSKSNSWASIGQPKTSHHVPASILQTLLVLWKAWGVTTSWGGNSPA